MRLADKTERYSLGNKTFVGKKKKYTVIIHFVAKSFMSGTSYWWYSLKKNDINYTYNSLWDNKRFETEELCVADCEKMIDEISKKK